MELFEITTQQERRRVAPLFDGVEDALIDVFAQGGGGYGWCDDLAHPRCAMIVSKNFNFIFYGGDSSCPNAKDLAAVTPEGCEKHKSYALIPCEDGWLPLLEEARPGKCSRVVRHRMKREKSGFEKEKLREYMRALPGEYVLLGMDEELYELAKAQEWSRNLVATHDTAEDFVENGFGFCVLHGDDFVAGASSYAVFDEGIDIQINTREDHRRKGLALACGAALVLNCLAQNKLPCWEAANDASLALAQKLGFQPGRSYEALIVKE